MCVRTCTCMYINIQPGMTEYITYIHVYTHTFILMNEWPHGYRKLSGPHVCGDALHIDPSSLNIVTGSWRYQDSVQVTDCMHVIHHTFIDIAMPMTVCLRSF